MSSSILDKETNKLVMIMKYDFEACFESSQLLSESLSVPCLCDFFRYVPSLLLFHIVHQRQRLNPFGLSAIHTLGVL